MKDESLINEIQDVTHKLQNDISIINVMMHQLEKMKTRHQKRWDEMVLLKYKVEKLEREK